MDDRPDFSLAQLRYFVAVADTGSISIAAEQLHVSQSALSTAIQRLEAQFNCTLFIRHRSRGVSLSPCGRRLLGGAKAMLRQASDLKTLSRTVHNEVVGDLQVGCFPGIAPFLIPPVIKELRQRYPDLTVQVREAGLEHLQQLVREGSCDIILTHPDCVAGEFATIPLAELPPYLLVEQAHPLVPVGRASLAELARQPVVVRDHPRVIRYFQELFHCAGVAMPSMVKTTSFETMRGLVAAGAGFSIVHHREAIPAVTLDGGRLSTLEITDDLSTLPLGLQTLHGVRRHSRVQAFIAACRVATAEFLGLGG
jgi:DNA-binding transcriptional LysR family regulator